MRIILVWILAVTMIGCAAEQKPNYVIVVDREFGSDVVEAVERAAKEWTDATGVASFVIRTGHESAFASDDRASWPDNVITVVPGAARPGEGEWSGRTTRGECRNASVIRIHPDYKTRSDVIAHELGHAMDLEHGPGGVMEEFDPFVRNPHVDENDVRRFCDRWAC